MGRVSVVVPTAGRPHLLRTTLRSIARQSALEQVDEVIVSENSGSEATSPVCEEFPDLPIEFRMTDAEMDSFAHFALLLTSAKSPYVAMVCDDDWWAPGHLETAIRNLDAVPSASAHASCYVAVGSELPVSGVFWGLGAIWLAAGRPDPLEPYVLDLPAVLALSWAFTPFSFTTLVARREALPESVREMQLSPHTYYEDRLLFTALAKHGPVVYEPLVDTCYRVHPGNWQAKQDPAFLLSLQQECADYVMGLAQEAGADPPSKWRELLADVPSDVLGPVSDLLRGQLGREWLGEYGLEDLLTPEPAATQQPLPRRAAAAFKRRLLGP